MASLTYPTPALNDLGTLTTEQIHELLRSQPLLARRLRTLADQKFIADALLKGRFQAVGGAVLYENGTPIMIAENPESVKHGGDYARSQANTGELAAARVDNWGRDEPVTDESIKRRGVDVVNEALKQNVNRMVKFVDAAALGVIASKITQTSAATAGWTSADAIVESVELAKARAEESGEGHVLDTIVLRPTQYARVMALFLKAGFLPREESNPLITGSWPQVLDLTWLRSPNVPTTAPLVVDTDELGGMADEQLGGPGYVGGLNGIESKAIRQEETDSYLVRGRRVTVPVVTDSTAGVTITGTGL